MIAEDFRIGIKVEVTKPDDSTVYHSSVYDIEEDVFYITVPYSQANPLIVRRGEPVKIKYFSTGAAYVFTVKLINRLERKNSLPLYIFPLPDPARVNRVQQRAFVRVPARLDVFYAEEPVDPENPAYVKTAIVDLSGGGMKMAVKKPVKMGTKLLLKFTIPKKPKLVEMSLRGKVVRSELVDQELGIYHLGIEFLDITRGNQDSMLGYLFEKLAEQTRRR